MENTIISPITMNNLGEKRDKLENTGSHPLGGIVENTTIQPGTRQKSGELENTGYHTFMVHEMDRATSPTTSTPSSTPSPNRYRDGRIRDSELDDSGMSMIDSSVAETLKPENKMEESEGSVLDGKSMEKKKEAQDTSDLSGEETGRMTGSVVPK